MALVYLIRHGEPETTGVMLGQMDAPLSDEGRRQAKALSTLQVEMVWSSPLRRARESAACLLCKHIAELPELREIDLGDWTGKRWDEIESEWPEVAARKLADWFRCAAPGGEEWDAFLHRVQNAWDRIKAGPFPAAVVAHQGVNAALLNLIQGSDPLQFRQGYGEVIRVAYD